MCDLENNNQDESLLWIKAVGHTLNHMLDHNHTSMPHSIIDQAKPFLYNVSAFDNYIATITADNTFPVFCSLFSRRYLQELKIFYTQVEQNNYQHNNYPPSRAQSLPPPSVLTSTPRHRAHSIGTHLDSGDQQFAFIPKPDLRPRTVKTPPIPSMVNKHHI